MNQDDDELSSLIRQHATRHTAPDALRASIRTQIALAEAGRAPAPLSTKPPGRRWLALAWPTAAAGFALGMLCMALVLPVAQRLHLNQAMDAELVTDHVRALQVGPLTEVASTDRHTVKPWFQGRLDFAPPVFDLAADGFPLLGGRTERVRGDVVAALAYARNRHMIDVFVWPTTALLPPVRSVHRGFNIVHWADKSMQYWAVSDLDGTELERFARVWQEHVTAK